MESDHVYFLLQGIPTMSASRIVTIVKSIIAKEIFNRHLEVETHLWGRAVWTSGYYANTVGQYSK